MATGHDERITPDRAYLGAGDPDRPLRHALEVRHESFRTERAVAVLRRYGVALVVADTAGRWPLITEPTSDHMYVRLHGDQELYVSGYSADALDSWAQKILTWRDSGLDVYVYFDNDVKVHAPYDALALIQRCGIAKPTATVVRP